MDLDAQFAKIMQELKLGHRALVRFNQNELENLEEKLNHFFLEKDLVGLEKILCLVEHSAALNSKFEPGLLKVLNSDLPDHLLVFALNGARKHIIQAKFQRGQRLSYDFLEILKKKTQSAHLKGAFAPSTGQDNAHAAQFHC